MTTGYAGQAINSVLNSKMGFCKFLSANDTGATGGHQSGILISKSAVRMLFTSQELEQEGIPKRTVKIISRCTTPNPAARYQSYEELESALEKLERRLKFKNIFNRKM